MQTIGILAICVLIALISLIAGYLYGFAQGHAKGTHDTYKIQMLSDPRLFVEMTGKIKEKMESIEKAIKEEA